MKLGFKTEPQARDGDGWRGRLFAAKDKEKDRRGAAAAEPLQVAHEIGARFELVSEKLETAQRVAEQIQELTGLLSEVRGPVLEEFKARRIEHAELQAALASGETARERLEELERANLDLVSRAAGAEASLADIEAKAAALEASLRGRDSEIEHLKLDRADRKSQFGEIEQAHKAATQRLAENEEEMTGLRTRAEFCESRLRESEAQLAKLQQERVLSEQDFAVLLKRLEQTNTEAVQLSGKVETLEDQLSAERKRTAELEARLLAAESENAKSSRLLEGRLEGQRAELGSIDAKLEAAQARTAKLDELNTGLTQRLTEAAARQKAVEDEKVELQLAQERALAAARAREQETEAMRRDFLALEAARAAAVERADELARLAQSRETAAKRAERQIVILKERLDTTQADHARRRAVLDERLSKVQTQFERERAERAIIEGALDTARRERGRTPDPAPVTREEFVAERDSA